jgi:hypothetical protein
LPPKRKTQQRPQLTQKIQDFPESKLKIQNDHKPFFFKFKNSPREGEKQAYMLEDSNNK